MNDPLLGRDNSTMILAWIRDQIRRTAYCYRPEKPFLLSSGTLSPHYVDCRRALCRSPVMSIVCMQIAAHARAIGANAIGGPAVGAAPLVYGAAFANFTQTKDVGEGIRAFLVRTEEKVHGMGGRMVGEVSPGHSALIVDDVLTSGGSLISTIECCQVHGIFVKAAFVLVDREEGGHENVERETGVRVHAMMTMASLCDAA